MPNYTLETYIKICNDSTGRYMEIGPDSDGLDLIEIKDFDDNKILLDPEQAILLAEAILKLYGKKDATT